MTPTRLAEIVDSYERKCADDSPTDLTNIVVELARELCESQDRISALEALVAEMQRRHADEDTIAMEASEY